MGKTWFITGASRGIGLEIAKAALASGDNVVMTARQSKKLAENFASHQQTLALDLDVTNVNQIQAATELALNRFGRIDVLVNNAGYGQLGAFEEIEPKDIETQFETNVFGLMNVTRTILPIMRRQRSGHIINLSSVGGALGFVDASIYCASKFAVEGFTASLALEIEKFGISSTIVEPGFFRTDFLDNSSVRYGTLKIEDYAKDQSVYENYNHKQAGDPAKLGQMIVKLTTLEKPPLHYVAGSDAFGMVRGALDSRQQELEQWRDFSFSTDGDFSN